MQPPAGVALLTIAIAIAGWCITAVVCQGQGQGQGRYFGREVGALSQLHHGVKGKLYAVDSRTLFLKDFHYDGEGPAAYFYVGTSKSPSASGAIRLRDERGGASPLRKYRGESITLALPDGNTLKDVKWFSVWCDEYAVNFGDVSIPRELEYPRPAKVGALRGVHGVSSDPIVVVDAQTLLVPNFSYDGEAPDAKFWVGRGDKPSPQGIRIADENGKEAPLRKYDKKTIVLTLPGELTVFDIGHFAVWCEAFTVNFGHIALPPQQLASVPPSLKMLGVSPQSKLNCEVLHDELAFEVRWAVAGDSIVLQLVAKLDDGEYMSFGPSGDPNHSQMVGGDAAVAWVDKNTLKGYAVDYYLDAKSQCAGVRGSCPDERLVENTNSIRLLNAALVNGYSIVTYQRSLKAADELDKPVFTNASQPIIWAIGPLNSRNEVSYHTHFTKEDKFIEFGRPPVWNCPMPEAEEEQQPVEPPRKEAQKAPQAQPTRAVIKPNPVPTPKPVARVAPWEIPAIQCYEPPDGVFYAQMGPTGGKQGYPAITGHVGWGISWYINGLLIPEINVVRGKKYTFVVEGGVDPEVPARYHPFYITNDPVGGYFHKTDEEKKGVQIYAGVRRTRSGELNPIGVGRLCNWTPDKSGPDADEYPSFGAYQRSLTLVCEEGNPGVVTWIPDKNTPDTVYYQCFTHRYLGWKINVVDECDITEAEESRVVEHFVKPDDHETMESIQVHSRTSPGAKFLDNRRKFEKLINTKTNYDNFSSYKDGELTGEVYRTEDRNQLYQQGQEIESPISNGQIREVIETVESIESQMRENLRRNASKLHDGIPAQYQVHEDVKDFLPETPIREEDEYFVDTGKRPENYLLPPNQKPLTLQSVLRPGPNKPAGPKRPFRRPSPPEIKLRRPPPPHMFQKGNTGYPLPMPNAHGPYGMKKPQQKFPNNRPPTNRLQGAPPGIPASSTPGIPSPPVPPMKSMPLPQHFQHQKPHFNQIQKQGPKNNQLPQSKQPVSVVLANSAKGPTLAQSQTLNLGNTDIIGSQVVKSQIMLPGAGDAIAQQSVPQAFLKPGSGQIILGRPIDTPVPLDQQLYTKQQVFITPPTSPPVFYQSSTAHNFVEQIDMKSSDFIGETADESVSPYTPAVNTGFKPDSIVVESGFKPIIREPLMAAEDRIAEYESNSNRREDTDVEEDYEESPQYISNAKPNVPSEKLTETFEPMFIPSPPDHLLPTNDRTKEIFPSNHAKEDRPHPVYIKTESELNALFSKKNMEKEVPSDMVMASDRISPHYLPPDPKLSKDQLQKLTNEQTFTTYDGKIVSAATLTSVPDMMKSNTKFSAKLPANSELLLKMPQFGPFKGEIPPPVAAHIGKEAQKASKDPVPPPDTRTTHLQLVNIHKSDELELDDLKADGSERHEVTVEPDEKVEDYEEDYEEEEEERTRRKRESKTTVFQRGEVEEQTPSNRERPTKNQIDYERVAASASTTALCWTALVLLLCVKLF